MATFLGSIKSTELGTLGDQIYGFLDFKTDDEKHLKLKIMASTQYDTLAVGARVRVVGDRLGNTEFWIAKEIVRIE